MKIIDLSAYLREHSYPGRGILLGRSADNKSAVIAYFIMGRSANSRNRVFTPVRYVEKTGDTVVTNGDQTDTVRDGILAGKVFAQALRVRCFEPDPPNYTPRISGLLHKNGAFALSILKSADGDPSCNHRYFFGYDNPLPGEGRFIHTYQENLNPLPSFEGEPRRVALTAPDAGTLAKEIWENLNEDNKVSLFVRYIDLESGKTTDKIINKNV